MIDGMQGGDSEKNAYDDYVKWKNEISAQGARLSAMQTVAY